ncbi:MAG: AraC family transcriptional regulator [Ginsengibacter sp.]
MKVLPTEISPGINNFFSLTEKGDDFFNVPFHFHPELELVFIADGFGKRIIGDRTGFFHSGDIVVIGSNLPHAWISDDEFNAKTSAHQLKAIVFHLDKNIFSPGFYDTKDALHISEFFKIAQKGITITGKTREVIEKHLMALLHKEAFERTLGLFEVLHILSKSNDLGWVLSDEYKPQLTYSKTDRLAEAYQYVQENFKDTINLSTISAISNLAPQSFCRLFKKKTGKSFVAYVNELRVEEACKYLKNTDWTIAEIAYNSGFKTVSNFNKLFKSITGINPTTYKAASK